MPSDEEMAAYLAGVLREQEQRAFEESLTDDPEARRELRNQQRMSTTLRVLHAHEEARMAEAVLAAMRDVRDLSELPMVVPIRKARTLWMARGLAVAAAVAMCATLYWHLIPKQAARVNREVAAAWEGGGSLAGQGLRPGWLKLQRGVVELEFSRGAKVTVEGPAELQLISGKEAYLRHGRLRAMVPERARGFTVRGDGFAAVDLGTEFGVIAGDAPELHVFTGTVEFQGSMRRLLGKTEALRLSSGSVESIPARPELFADDKRLAALEAGEKLDVHPAAIAHYDFAPQGTRLHNRVKGLDLMAEVSGCDAVEGRWPGSGALAFGKEEDHVSLQLPGEMKSLTLLAWVRIDAFPEVQGSLTMGSTELPGDVHWYVHNSGVLGFAVIGGDGRWHYLHSPVVIRRQDLGKWRCLAASFDGATGSVTHFLDGEVIASETIGTTGPLKPGTVQVGNWALRAGSTLRASKNKTTPADFKRALPGRIDELAIFSTALSAAEVRRITEAGKP